MNNIRVGGKGSDLTLFAVGKLGFIGENYDKLIWATELTQEEYEKFMRRVFQERDRNGAVFIAVPSSIASRWLTEIREKKLG